ncbi:Yip1 family protein [Desulfotomaculum sp. 1211_IL3151]|uniref:Yip1 family protein n=1 Tax=Desulfotomaculum sp. 1211_IL3151 TaxID=3084055 RepID=UPI002FD87F68
MNDRKEQNPEQLSNDPIQKDQLLPPNPSEMKDSLTETEATTRLDEDRQPPLQFYEIVYGVLFDPVSTMKRIAVNPPLYTTLLIVILVSLIGLLTELYSSSQGTVSNWGLPDMPFSQSANISQALRAATPLLAIFGTIFVFLKWFFYSALLHLVADFYGGRGRARTVFVVYGLAGLPEVFLIPLGVITTWLSGGLATGIMVVANLLIFIWGMILLTIGLREAHHFSTGRALTVIFTPVIVMLLLAIIGMVGLMAVLSASIF